MRGRGDQEIRSKLESRLSDEKNKKCDDERRGHSMESRASQK